VTGNDDLGQMSAWYVFSALGMYPVTPGTGQFVLNAPRFSRAVIHLENGRDITITAAGADSSKLQYVRALRVGAAPRDKAYLNHSQLRNGAHLDYRLTTDPAEATWGTGPNSAPASPCTGEHVS
jgi:putative alpha-1,2-mannosidase